MSAPADHLRTTDLEPLSQWIDQDRPFYVGSDKSCAPHLPVGSPERAALFARLSETFAEDWKAAEVAVEAERRAALGDLYFVRVGDFLKIGRTNNFQKRLMMIDCHSPVEPEVLGVIPGGGHRERAWHRSFKHLRSRREWFRLTPELERAAKSAVANAEQHDAPTLSNHPEGN